ncbi:unnamed protein product [Cuscuta campestris]|uniref:Uncharacterized protein n=1 Tax=Cuscuta campestris TaxID=132261 RepID=A0A484MMU2_9ASTE|nr:unnamed protein product [Cuscuta campestris]
MAYENSASPWMIQLYANTVVRSLSKDSLGIPTLAIPKLWSRMGEQYILTGEFIVGVFTSTLVKKYMTTKIYLDLDIDEVLALKKEWFFAKGTYNSTAYHRETRGR